MLEVALISVIRSLNVSKLNSLPRNVNISNIFFPFYHISCEISSSERANVPISFNEIILLLSLLSVCARNLLIMTLIGIGTRTCIHGHTWTLIGIGTCTCIHGH